MGGRRPQKKFGKKYQKGEGEGVNFLKYISLIEDYKPEVRQSDLGQTAEPVVFEQPDQLNLNRGVLLTGEFF